jgi:hypothetical protein
MEQKRTVLTELRCSLCVVELRFSHLFVAEAKSEAVERVPRMFQELVVWQLP